MAFVGLTQFGFFPVRDHCPLLLCPNVVKTIVSCILSVFVVLGRRVNLACDLSSWRLKFCPGIRENK